MRFLVWISMTCLPVCIRKKNRPDEVKLLCWDRVKLGALDSVKFMNPIVEERGKLVKPNNQTIFCINRHRKANV